MIWLKSFCLGAVVGLIVALGLFVGHPPIADTINASSMPWLPVSMLLISFAGLFGVAYLATFRGYEQASGSGLSKAPPASCRAMAMAPAPLRKVGRVPVRRQD